MSPEKEKLAALLVSDDAGLRREYARRLERLGRVEAVDPAALAHPARLVDLSPGVVLLSGADAAAALEAMLPIKGIVPAGNLVLVVADVDEADVELALERLRPRHLLVHPVSDPALRFAVSTAAPSLAGRGARPQQRPARALLGVSAAIRGITDQIERVAPSRIPVLILGETGTGKELVARAIHEQSSRAGAPFIAVNCGALPEGLLEAELFGYRKGSFTGATRDHRGLFREADGGTLFLDEIGETSPGLQVKLLRVLETGEVRAIGGREVVSVDVRLVSATHRDLEQAIEEGGFRQDLFYRLNTTMIVVPPLRRRRVDIPFLAQHFAEEFGSENARQITLGDDFLDALAQRDFPGNVRELRNAIERAITLADHDEALGVDDLQADDAGRPAFYPMGTLKDRIAQVEIQAIQEALERFDGNKTHAARALGISRLGLRDKMKRLGLA